MLIDFGNSRLINSSEFVSQSQHWSIEKAGQVGDKRFASGRAAIGGFTFYHSLGVGSAASITTLSTLTLG
jgi:hypothetical protein